MNIRRINNVYHSGAYEEDKSRNGYGHLFREKKRIIKMFL